VIPLLALLAAGPFTFEEISPASLALLENGKPVFVYNHGLMSKEGVPESRNRCCYLHPVYTPGGTALTDDFPRDHYHHRGISWMWPVVRVDSGEFDLWAIKGIRHQFLRWVARETGPRSARLAVENGWFTASRQVAKELVEVVAHPSRGGRRTLEWTLTVEALGAPLAIAGAPEERKGYGGLGFRFAPRENTVLRTDAGVEPKDTNMIPHRWAEIEAVFGGRKGGARIEVDPSSAGYPNGWCLRRYGYLGVNYPGLDPVTIEPGKPLKLKARITLFDAAE
jgi:hypothetical protein